MHTKRYYVFYIQYTSLEKTVHSTNFKVTLLDATLNVLTRETASCINYSLSNVEW